MTRHEKIVASVLAILIIATTFLSFGTEFVGYPKVGGLSMEPTIHQPLYIPFGDPSIRHRGAFVHINQTIDPTVGSIVMFRHGSDRDVKRIDKIRGDSAVWVIADNVGVTGMDSREYGWIPADNIIGVVDRIITPRRIVRSLTKEGRWWNAMEMSFGSLHRVTENYVVVNNHDGNTYLCSPNTELLLGRSNRGSNATPSLRGNRLAVPLADGVAVVDLTVGSAKVVPANRVAMARWLDDSHVCIRMLMGVNDPSSIVEVGS